MKRVMLVIAYDGTNYCGWQLQNNGITIEEALNKALSDLLREPIAVIGASRTDSGVHALGNVAVFDTENRMPADKMCFALNHRLPDDIRIQRSEEVAPDFHPRRCNCVKTYEYKILNSKIEMPVNRLYTHFCYIPLDVELMQKAAVYLEGEHDFKSFCTTRTQAEETVRTLYSLNVTKAGDVITIRVSGSGFLYNMVRIIAGTLMKVGMKAYPPEHVEEIIDARDRNAAGPKAAAAGLTLVSLEYEREVKPVIKAQNKYWSYRLNQKEIPLKKTAYLCIERCVPDDFERLMQRVIHQAVRNGAHKVYISRSDGTLIEEKAYGFYPVEAAYDVKKLWMAAAMPVKADSAAVRLTAQEADESDREAFLDLYAEVFSAVQNSGIYDWEDFIDYLEQDNQKLYLFRDENRNLVGFAGVCVREGEMTLDILGIRPSLQGRGLGAVVLDKVMEAAVGEECGQIVLLVCTENIHAVRLYQKYGFQETGVTIPWYLTEDNRK